MVDFPQQNYRHGLDKFMPDGMTSLLSNSRPITPMRRKEVDQFLEADIYLWRHLWERYHDQPFPRGYLDAGRLNRLFRRQILPVDTPYNDRSQATRLRCIPYEPVLTG